MHPKPKITIGRLVIFSVGSLAYPVWLVTTVWFCYLESNQNQTWFLESEPDIKPDLILGLNETWDSVLELELEFLKKQMGDEWFKTEG